MNSTLNSESSEQHQQELMERRYSSSMMILNSGLSNEVISSCYSRDSSINQDVTNISAQNDHKNQAENKNETTSNDKYQYDEEYELDSRQELMLNSIGTGSDNSAYNLHENLSNCSKYKKNSILFENLCRNQNSFSKMIQEQEQPDDYASSLLLDYENIELEKQKSVEKRGNDETTRGGPSTTYNVQMDSLSTLSDKKKKVIVRIVTVFSVVFFLICFAMIAFTLRMSEKIDAQIRKGYSGSNFNGMSFSTKSIHPLLISQYVDSSKSFKTNIIHKIKISSFVANKLVETATSTVTTTTKADSLILIALSNNKSLLNRR